MKTCAQCATKNGTRAAKCSNCGTAFGQARHLDFTIGGNGADIEVSLSHDGSMLLLWPGKNEYLKFDRWETEAIKRALA